MGTNRGFPVEDAIAILDTWFARGQNYAWNMTPGKVKCAMRTESRETGWLDYQRAVGILRDAESCASCGSANAGMQWIREEWAKRAISGPPEDHGHESTPRRTVVGAGSAVE